MNLIILLHRRGKVITAGNAWTQNSTGGRILEHRLVQECRKKKRTKKQHSTALGRMHVSVHEGRTVAKCTAAAWGNVPLRYELNTSIMAKKCAFHSAIETRIESLNGVCKKCHSKLHASWAAQSFLSGSACSELQLLQDNLGSAKGIRTVATQQACTPQCHCSYVRLLAHKL